LKESNQALKMSNEAYESSNNVFGGLTKAQTCEGMLFFAFTNASTMFYKASELTSKA